MKQQGYNQRIQLGVDRQLNENEPFTRLVSRMWPETSPDAPDDERRKDIRHSTVIPCIIRISRKGNEILVLNGVIRNISTSGMLLELRDKGHLYTAMFREIEAFQVSLILNDNTVTCVECFPRHIEDNDQLAIGVRVGAEDPPCENMRFLM
ncbi:hypothetical protein LN040_17290 [Desulfovibrio subterraneus]|uniref:hypothetical protein n=1 Tax=Desulfovibrio subterraneus TaxID=2718620 RepID=UPI0022B88D04|nr:hypothetical protein [Desulfovibrio subterraneus]WBF67437.1 hypothetical protein LN040_17290 [Desulfovibrio subterraneus]